MKNYSLVMTTTIATGLVVSVFQRFEHDRSIYNMTMNDISGQCCLELESLPLAEILNVIDAQIIADLT